MKLTLDTNVLVSSFISKKGQPAALLDAALILPRLELVLSEPILDELSDVLTMPEVRERFPFSLEEVRETASDLRNASRMVELVSSLKVVKDDPKDDVIVNTAWDGKADFIVSGDHHLRNLKKFRKIRIVSASSMLNIIGRRFGEHIAGDL
jgi:putative PIN family toxin of toxin-antitoxin system